MVGESRTSLSKPAFWFFRASRCFPSVVGRPGLLFLLLVPFTGCSARIIPPARVADPVSIFVADYGRHSSILLPARDGNLVEFAWGDYDWFAANRTGIGNALAALFWSHGSTIGIRHLAADAQRADLRQIVGCDHLLHFAASGQKAIALREQLIARIDRHRETMIYNPTNDFSFVRDDERYVLWHNCNHLTAQWLRELGCQVKGTAVLSHFELEEGP